MMDLVQRAHIFNCFDALKGYHELLEEQEKIPVEKRVISEDEIDELNRRVYTIKKGMMVTIEYFNKNDILCMKGIVSRINLDTRKIQLVKTIIDLNKIIWIEIEDESYF